LLDVFKNMTVLVEAGIRRLCKSLLPCSSSLREVARWWETPALTGHPESLTPALSLRERE